MLNDMRKDICRVYLKTKGEADLSAKQTVDILAVSVINVITVLKEIESEVQEKMKQIHDIEHIDHYELEVTKEEKVRKTLQKKAN